MVWAGFTNDEFFPNIFAYDLAAGTEQQLTSHPLGQEFPTIAGDDVVFLDDRDGSRIFRYSFSTHAPPRLPRGRPQTVEWRRGPGRP